MFLPLWRRTPPEGPYGSAVRCAWTYRKKKKKKKSFLDEKMSRRRVDDDPTCKFTLFLTWAQQNFWIFFFTDVLHCFFFTHFLGCFGIFFLLTFYAVFFLHTFWTVFWFFFNALFRLFLDFFFTDVLGCFFLRTF